jgi:hypothetical protein
MDWQLHWLEAEGDLNTWREQIATEVAATYAIVSRLITPTPPWTFWCNAEAW